MSNTNYLKAGRVALATLAGMYTTGASAQMFAANGPSQSQLEQTISATPKDSYELKSGVGFYPANDSFYSMGVNGIQQIELYSDAQKTNARMAVKMKVSEHVYDWRNEQKAEVSILLIPDGSSLPTPKPTLDLSYGKTVNGKSARGGLFGLGFYVASGSTGASLIAAVAEAGIDYGLGRSRNRSVHAVTLKNIPDQEVKMTVDRVAGNYELNGIHYTLSVDVNAKGNKNSKFDPDLYQVRKVDLKQYGGQGEALELTSRDNRMRNNIWALLAGYATGTLYDALAEAGATVAGGQAPNPGPYTPPTGTPATITGGQTGAGLYTVPPGG